MHIYAHPLLPYPVHLRPGTIVNHKHTTAPLVIVSGPERGIRGEVYRVRTPAGETVRVLRENLKL